MASIGYTKPHYSLLSSAQKSIYVREWLYDEENQIPPLISKDIFRVIKAIQRINKLSVVYFNNQYWVVTYP